MLPCEYLPGLITEDAQAYLPTNRISITSTGAKDNTHADTISDRKTSDSAPPTSQSPQLLEDVNEDTSVPSRATTPPPTEDVDITSKRSASVELADQPDPKKVKVSTWSDDEANGADVDETDLLSSQNPQQLEDTLAHENTTPRTTTTPPTEDHNTTLRRSASVQPADQPDMERIKVSTSSEGDGVGRGVDEIDQPSPHHLQQLEESIADNNNITSSAKTPPPQPEQTPADHSTAPRAETPQPTSTTNFNITPKRSASRPPADQPDPKRVQLFVQSDVNGIVSGGSISIRHAYILSKRRALAQPVDQPDAKRVWMSIPSDKSSGRGVFVDVLSPSYPEVLQTPKAAFGLPGDNALKPRLVGNAGIEGGDEEKINRNKPGKDKNDKDKVGSDSDVCEVIEAKSTPATKKRTSTAAGSVSAKNNKGKQSQQPETPDTEASPSARTSAVKASNTRGKTATRATTVDESEAAGEEDDDDDEYDEGESEHEDPRVAKKKIAQADKVLSVACKSCTFSANKAWKQKHESTVSKLNQEHRAVIRALKADRIADLKKAKATADKDKKAAKAKAEQAVEDVKDTGEEKFDNLKAKLEGELKVLKKSFAAEKVKVTGLKGQLERAEEIRKKIEKDAAEKVKNAEADLRAGVLEQREKWKQLKREAQAEADQWKPQHSKTVKDNQRVIKELTQKCIEKENELAASEEDLRRSREQASAEKSHHAETREKLAEAKASDEERLKQVLQFERHCKRVEERNQTHVARVEEQLAMANNNLQQQSNRVVDKQRENYQLGDAMRAHAKISEARKVEIERLKKELQAAQAELGLAKDIEELDDGVVEVGRGEAVRGGAVKGEAVKGEVTKGEVVQRVGVEREGIQGEVLNGEGVEGEVV
jgi:hypothetical protein